MGVLMVASGKLLEAKPFFEIALKWDSSCENYWLSIIKLNLLLGEKNIASILTKKAQSKGFVIPSIDDLKDRTNIGSEQNREKPHLASQKTEREKLLELFDQGKFSELITCLQEIFVSRPKDEFVLSMLGVANIKTSNFKVAEEYIRTALQTNPYSTQNWLNLGIVLEKQDKFYEAAAGFNKVVELDPNDFKPHFYLGLLSQKIGNDEEP